MIIRRLLTITAILLICSSSYAATLLSESFEDQSFSSRGWYDNTTHGTIAGSGYSGNCLQWAWTSGQTTPTNGGSMRYDITDTDKLYVKFYVKFASNWEGSQQTYHPHLIMVLSDLDSAYGALGTSYLDTYIEFLSDIGSPYNVYIQTAYQDSLRVNTSYGTPPIDLTSITETRAATYCNGLKSGADTPSIQTCYNSGGWYSQNVYTDSTVSISKNTWVKVEVYFEMNTISGGIGQADGVMKSWINGTLVQNYAHIVYRTNQDATKKWGQVVLGPYIGDGAPIDETMWIDELEIKDEYPNTATVTGVSIH